jgi:hypothetical protein
LTVKSISFCTSTEKMRFLLFIEIEIYGWKQNKGVGKGDQCYKHGEHIWHRVQSEAQAELSFSGSSAKDVAKNEGSNKIKDSESDREAANDTQSSLEFAETEKHVSLAHAAGEC